MTDGGAVTFVAQPRLAQVGKVGRVGPVGGVPEQQSGQVIAAAVIAFVQELRSVVPGVVGVRVEQLPQERRAIEILQPPGIERAADLRNQIGMSEQG